MVASGSTIYGFQAAASALQTRLLDEDEGRGFFGVEGHSIGPWWGHVPCACQPFPQFYPFLNTFLHQHHSGVMKCALFNSVMTQTRDMASLESQQGEARTTKIISGVTNLATVSKESQNQAQVVYRPFRSEFCQLFEHASLE